MMVTVNALYKQNDKQQLPLVSLRRFRGDMGVVPSTVWRWTQRGWLEKPINIGGRQYLTSAMIQRFLDRAAHGEFAGGAKPPARACVSIDQGGHHE